MAQEGRSRLSRLLDRQLKAAEREVSRLRQAARALRRQVKQRQISRVRERTVKHELRVFVREPGHHVEDAEHNLAEYVKKLERLKFHVSLILSRPYDGWFDWRNITHKGWKVVAVYRNRAPAAGGEWSGHFIAFNILKEDVLLSEYTLSTRDYCRDCFKYQCHHPRDNIRDILEKPYCALSRKEAFLAPAKTFLVVAQRRRVPGMKHRRLQPEDHGYRSLVTLYAAYTLFHSRVVQKRPSWEWPSKGAVKALAAWQPREWTQRRLVALVRVQAMWRRWHLRHRMLYSPHTELGRRYLMRAWRRDLEHFVPE